MKMCAIVEVAIEQEEDKDGHDFKLPLSFCVDKSLVSLDFIFLMYRMGLMSLVFYCWL